MQLKLALFWRLFWLPYVADAILLPSTRLVHLHSHQNRMRGYRPRKKKTFAIQTSLSKPQVALLLLLLREYRRVAESTHCSNCH